MIITILLVAFIIMPFIELSLLLKIHEHIGTFHTLGLVIATGIIGAFLAKAQGIMIISKIQQEVAKGRMPAPYLIDGVMILIAGILLITPGLITDTVGFALLVPPIRFSIRMYIRKVIEDKLRNGSMNITTFKF